MPYPIVNLTLAGGGNQEFLATVRSNIPYAEVAEGLTEEWSVDSQAITRICDVNWPSRHAFRLDMLGATYHSPGGSAGGFPSNLNRIPPEVHGEFPGLYAQECRLLNPLGVPPDDVSDLAKALSSKMTFPSNQLDPATNGPLFAIARFVVVYKDLPYNVYDDGSVPATPFIGELNRYITRTPSYGADVLGIPGQAFAIATTDGSTNLSIPEGPQVLTSFQEFHYLFHQLPFIPSDQWDLAANKVNSVTFDGIYPPETVIFTGYSPERRYHQPNGNVAWDAVLSFIYRKQGHNYFPFRQGPVNGVTLIGRTGLFGFNLITQNGLPDVYLKNGDSNRVFDQTDLNQLFAFPSIAPPIP